MRAGNGDAVLQARQFGQHLRTANHGNLAALCREDLGIVVANRRRSHHDVGVADILRGVRVEDGGALPLSDSVIGVERRSEPETW